MLFVTRFDLKLAELRTGFEVKLSLRLRFLSGNSVQKTGTHTGMTLVLRRNCSHSAHKLASRGTDYRIDWRIAGGP